MRKLIKNNKGFTLIELMMVIAVIGILAAVLVPKMGGIKDNAKVSGVEANARQVEAQVHGIIERYRHDADDFQDKLQEIFVDDGIENPFDNTKLGATKKGNSENVTAAVHIWSYQVDDIKKVSPKDIVPGTIYVFVNTDDKSNIKAVKIMSYEGDQKEDLLDTIVIEP